MPDVMAFDPELRTLLAENLRRHERLSIALDGRRHAAVAVVVVDSDPDRHGDDVPRIPAARLAEIPGADGLDLTGRRAG